MTTLSAHVGLRDLKLDFQLGFYDRMKLTLGSYWNSNWKLWCKITTTNKRTREQRIFQRQFSDDSEVTFSVLLEGIPGSRHDLFDVAVDVHLSGRQDPVVSAKLQMPLAILEHKMEPMRQFKCFSFPILQKM